MARETKPSPARTRARAPNRLRSSTQRNPDVRKFDRPRRAKRRRPLRTMPSGGRTNNPPGWIRSHHDRKSLSKFVFSVKTTPRIKRKNTTPIRATKSGRRTGKARAAGGIALRAEKAEGAVGTKAAGVGADAWSGSRDPQYTQNATSSSFTVPRFGQRTVCTPGPRRSGTGLRTFGASVFSVDPGIGP